MRMLNRTWTSLLKNFAILSLLIVGAACSDLPPDIPDPQDQGVDEGGLEGVDRIEEIAAMEPVKLCHYAMKLEPGIPQRLDVSGFPLSLDLIRTGVEGSVGPIDAEIRINEDEQVQFRTGEYRRVVFDDGTELTVGVTLIRDGNAMMCILTDEEFDVAYCDAKPEAEKHDCYDSLGYLHGEEYCEAIGDEFFKVVCVRGARGENG